MEGGAPSHGRAERGDGGAARPDVGQKRIACMEPGWGQVLLGLTTDCRYQAGSPFSETVGPEKPHRSMAVEEVETTCVAVGQGRGSAVGGSFGNSAVTWGGSELDCD